MANTAAKNSNDAAMPAKSSRRAAGALPSLGTEGPPWDHGEKRPDGRAWWQHELFPLDTTPPDVVARWLVGEQKAEARGGSGRPEFFTFEKWSAKQSAWIEIPGRFAVDSWSAEKILKKYHRGRFQVTAWCWLPDTGEGRKMIAVRHRTFGLGIDEEEEEEEDDDDAAGDDEPGDDEPGDDLTPAQMEIERGRLALKVRELELAAEQQKWERERQDRIERDEKERDRRDAIDERERQRDREHMKAIADLYTRGGKNGQDDDSPMGKLTEMLLKKAIDSVMNGGGEGAPDTPMTRMGTKAIESLADMVIEVGGPLAMGYAKKVGVDVEKVFPSDTKDDDDNEIEAPGEEVPSQ